MTKKIAQSHQPHANGKHCTSIFALNPLPIQTTGCHVCGASGSTANG